MVSVVVPGTDGVGCSEVKPDVDASEVTLADGTEVVAY